MEKRPAIPHKKRRNEINYDSSDSQEQGNMLERNSPWSSLKEGIYATVDTTISLVTFQKRKQKDPKFKFQQRVIDNGYGDQIESSNAMNGINRVPDTDLMLRQYEAMQRELRLDENNAKEASDTTPKVPPVVPSKDTTSLSMSAFDSFKDFLYSTGDAIRSLSSKKKDPKSIISTIKPIVKPLNNEGISLETQQLIPGLSSSDPIQRFQTKLKINNLDKDQRERESALVRASALSNAKGSFYFLIDVIQKFIEQVASIPTVATNTVQKTQKIAKNTVDFTAKTIKEIQETPRKIEKAQKNVQTSIQKTQVSLQNAKEIAEVVVQDVQNIPSVVKSSIEDTKTTVDNQIQSTQNTLEEIQNIPKKIKIMTGLEPPPPPPPPPPKTNKEVAIGLSLELAKGIGKGFFFVGKGALGLGFRGVKSIVVNSFTKDEAEIESKTLKGRFVSKRTVALERKKSPNSLKEEVETILSEADVVLSNINKEEISKPPAFFFSVLGEKTKESKVSQEVKKSAEETLSSTTSLSSNLPEKTKPEGKITSSKKTSSQESGEKPKSSFFGFLSKGSSSEVKNKSTQVSSPSDPDSDISDALQRAREAAARASAEVDEIEVMLDMKSKK